MKAGVYYGARDIRVEDIEDSQIGPADVLIKVRACGICGSDLHAYNQGIFSRPGWVMGHELSGDAVAVGERVKDIKQGDRLVPIGRTNAPGCGQCYWCQMGQPQWCEVLPKKPCGQCEYCKTGQFYLCKETLRYQAIGYSRNGGYSEYVTVWDATLNKNVFKIPDGMSYDEGAFIEPLNGCLEWISLAEPEPRDTAVVLGLGTIGLLMMQVLKDTVSRVIVSELSPRRLQVAKEFGADVVINATQEDPVQKVVEVTGVGRSRTGRSGGRADFVMECSGAGVA
ncbi:zinc-binding dehydrogenase, partial [Chloroflexota bacterium]